MFASPTPLAIVEVLVLQRFPYGQDSTFFYLAQKELLRIQEGDVVEIPWRNQFTQGVVVKIKKFMLDEALLKEEKGLDLKKLNISKDYFFSSWPEKPMKMKRIEKIIDKQYFKVSTLLTLKKLAEAHRVSWNHFVLSAYLSDSKMRFQRKSYLSIMGSWVKALKDQEVDAIFSQQKVEIDQSGPDPSMIFLSQEQISPLKNIVAETIRQKKQILVLTGEKAQTLPLAVKYFLLGESFLSNTPLILSKILPAALFKKTWQETKRKYPTIFIGNRSAIFAPFANLGLIIFENGHDANFKQWDSFPKYDTRDIVKDLFPETTKIYLSSTPRMEDFWQSPFFIEDKNGQESLVRADINNFLKFKKRDQGEDLLEKGEVYSSKYELLYQGEKKEINIVNLKVEKKLENKFLALGKKMEAQIGKVLQKKQWVAILAGHKGWANLLVCSDCGFIPECPECGKKMVISSQKILSCQNCGSSKPIFQQCPKCRGSKFRFDNFGLEQIQQELGIIAEDYQTELLIFPETGASFSKFLLFWQKLIDNLGRPAIILGYTGILPTLQLLRKNIGLSALIPFDNLLFYPDFRSEERTASRFFSLLAIAPKVIIQTYFPRHPFILQLVRSQYANFFPNWLKERKEFDYPPFSRLWELEINGSSAEAIKSQASQLKIELEKMEEIKEIFFSPRKIIFKGKLVRLSFFVRVKKDFNFLSLKKILPINVKIDPNPENLV